MKDQLTRFSLFLAVSGITLWDNSGKPEKDKLENISWISPEYGGNPRDLNRIRKVGPN